MKKNALIKYDDSRNDNGCLPNQSETAVIGDRLTCYLKP